MANHLPYARVVLLASFAIAIVRRYKAHARILILDLDITCLKEGILYVLSAVL